MRLLLSLLFLVFSVSAYCQDNDLLKQLEAQDQAVKKKEFVSATFKSTNLIHGQTIEQTAQGVMQFRILHRFGGLNTGVQQFFGLDNANIRLHLDYGILPWLMVGIGRSSFQKTLDGFVKARIIRQSLQWKKGSPLTLSAFASMAYKTQPFEDKTRKNYYTSKMYYAFQIIAASKLHEKVSLQIMPTLVHHNLVSTSDQKNDILSLGIGGRVKVSKRVSINAEYYYQIPSFKLKNTANSLALGIDIETGGHVFQIHLTNSTGMIEKAFISETNGKWQKGEILLGFNISRVFTIYDPDKRRERIALKKKSK